MADESKRGENKEPKPTIGRVVHYVLPNQSPNVGEHRAATIARVDGDLVRLTVNKAAADDFQGAEADIVHGKGATVLLADVRHDEEKAPGTWHWPERE